MSEVVSFLQGPEAASDKQYAHDQSAQYQEQVQERDRLLEADRLRRATLLRDRTKATDFLKSQTTQPSLTRVGAQATHRAGLALPSILRTMQSTVPGSRRTIGS